MIADAHGLSTATKSSRPRFPVVRQWARRQKVHPLPPMGLGGGAPNEHRPLKESSYQARSHLVPFTVVVAIVGFATTTAAMVMTVAAR